MSNGSRASSPSPQDWHAMTLWNTRDSAVWPSLPRRRAPQHASLHAGLSPPWWCLPLLDPEITAFQWTFRDSKRGDMSHCIMCLRKQRGWEGGREGRAGPRTATSVYSLRPPDGGVLTRTVLPCSLGTGWTVSSPIITFKTINSPNQQLNAEQLNLHLILKRRSVPLNLRISDSGGMRTTHTDSAPCVLPCTPSVPEQSVAF